jgi:hypothetical protein
MPFDTGMCGCAAAQMNLAAVGVLHVAAALEDPFDNQGLDGIYVDEALFEAQQARPLPPPAPSAQAACYAPPSLPPTCPFAWPP